jgi:hypothetical protein
MGILRKKLLYIFLLALGNLNAQYGFFEFTSPNGTRNYVLTTIGLKDSRAFAFPDSVPKILESGKTIHQWVSLDSIQWRMEYNATVSRIFQTYNISPIDFQSAYPEANLKRGTGVERKRKREAAEVPDIALGIVSRAHGSRVKSMFSIDQFGRFIGEWNRILANNPDSFPSKETLLSAYENEQWDSLLLHSKSIPAKLQNGVLKNARQQIWKHIMDEADRENNIFLIPWVFMIDENGTALSEKLRLQGYSIRPIKRESGERTFSFVSDVRSTDQETNLNLGFGSLKMRMPGRVLSLGNTTGKERMFSNDPFRKESVSITLNHLTTPLTSKEIKERIHDFNNAVENDKSLKPLLSNNHQEIKPFHAFRYFKILDPGNGNKTWLILVIQPTLISTITLATNQDSDDFDKRFLQAIQTMELTKNTESKGLQLFRNDTLGFEALVPFGINPQIKFLPAENNDINMDFSSYDVMFDDMSKAYSVNLSVYTYETGQFFLSDSSILASRFKPMFFSLVANRRKIKSYNFEPLSDRSGWVVTANAESKKEGVYFKSAFRNQRLYIMAVDYNPKKKYSVREAKRLIDSFNFLKTPLLSFNRFEDPHSRFTADVVGSLSKTKRQVPEKDEMTYTFADSSVSFLFRDTIASEFCEKRIIYFSPFSRINNVDTLLYDWIYSYVDEGKDSITDVRLDSLSGIRGFSYRLRTLDAFYSISPGITWFGWTGLNGNELINLLYVGRNDADARKYFNSLRVPKNHNDITETNWEALKKALHSEDEEVRASAGRAIHSFEITDEDDQEALFNVLTSNWKDDTLGIRSNRARLVDRIFAGRPEWLFDFIGDLIKNKDLDKNVAYNILLESLITDSSTFIAAVPRWILKINAAPDSSYGFSWMPYNIRSKEKLEHMGESLFLPLGLSQRGAFPWVYWIRRALEEDIVSKEQIIANTPRLLTHAAMLEKEATLYPERHLHEEILELVRILKHSPEGRDFIYGCLKHQWEDVRIAAQVALACSDSTFDRSYILDLAKEPVYLGDIYRQVLESKCENLLPLNLILPHKLGIALLHDRLSREESPTRIEYYDQVPMFDQEGPGNYYIYRLGYTKNQQMLWYFAAVGPVRENQPFPMDTKYVHTRFAPWYGRSIFQHLNYTGLTISPNSENQAQ